MPDQNYTIVARPKNYWMSPGAISITLNARNEADRMQASAAGGAQIFCFFKEYEEIQAETNAIHQVSNAEETFGYDVGHNFRSWPLQISPTYFNTHDAVYVYVAIPRMASVGRQAMVVFPSKMIDIYGRQVYDYPVPRIDDNGDYIDAEGNVVADAADAEQVYELVIENGSTVQVGSGNYYYIWLQGVITSSGDGSTPRDWAPKFDTGRLDTAESWGEVITLEMLAREMKKKVDVDWFRRIFTIHGTNRRREEDEDGEPIYDEQGHEIYYDGDDSTVRDVMPNDMSHEITDVESRFGLWTEQFLSALGSAGGGGEGGGDVLELNEPLYGINYAGLAAHPSEAGKTIVWDGTQWTYGNAGGGSGVGGIASVSLLCDGSPIANSGTELNPVYSLSDHLLSKGGGTVSGDVFISRTTPIADLAAASDNLVLTKGEINTLFAGKYVTVGFFSKLFQPYKKVSGQDVAVTVNDADVISGSVFIDNLKILVNTWTEGYLSALGTQGSSGSGGDAVNLNWLLGHINSHVGAQTTPASGQTLVFNGTNWTLGLAGLDESWLVSHNYVTTSYLSNNGYLPLGDSSWTGTPKTIKGYLDSKQYLTQGAADGRYVRSDFFSKLFQPYKKVSGQDVAVSVNDADVISGSVFIDNLKILVGTWTEGYLSALGTQGSSGSSPIELNSVLNGINRTTFPASHGATGTTIVWDGTQWTFGTVGISDIPNISWNKITSDKPTTLAGYGITDAVESSVTWWGRSVTNGAVSGSLENVGNITFGATANDGIYNIGASDNRLGTLYAKFGEFTGTAPAVHVGADGSNRISLHWSTNNSVSNRGLYDGDGWVIGYNGTNTFLSKGNVGIGTNSPAYLLDVSGYMRATRFYLHKSTGATGDADVYLEYDATNGGVHVVGSGLYADGYLSALGTQGSSGGTDTFNEAAMWTALGTTITAKKISTGYLNLTGYATETWVGQQGFLTSTALNGYATQDWVGQQGYLTSTALNGYATQEWVEEQGYGTDYTLPTASDSTKGGVKVGTTLAIANEVLNLAPVTVGTPASGDTTYTKVVVDGYGRVTKGTTLAASDIPSLSWTKITTDKPTTLAGYGITDAVTAIVAGSGTDANKIGVTVNGSNTGFITVPYATSAGSADTATSATSATTASKLTDNTYSLWGNDYISSGVPQSVGTSTTPAGLNYVTTINSRLMVFDTTNNRVGINMTLTDNQNNYTGPESTLHVVGGVRVNQTTDGLTAINTIGQIKIETKNGGNRAIFIGHLSDTDKSAFIQFKDPDNKSVNVVRLMTSVYTGNVKVYELFMGNIDRQLYLTGENVILRSKDPNDSSSSVEAVRAISGGRVIIGPGRSMMSGNNSATASRLIVDGYTYTSRVYLADGVYFEKDSTGVHLVGAGFYADSFISALGTSGSSGSNPFQLNTLLQSMNTSGVSAPNESGLFPVWDGMAWAYSKTKLIKAGSLNVSSTITAGGQITGAQVHASGFYVDGLTDPNTYILLAGGGTKALSEIGGGGGGGSVNGIIVGSGNAILPDSDGYVTIPAIPSTANLVSGIILGGTLYRPSSGSVSLPAYPDVSDCVRGIVISGSQGAYTPTNGIVSIPAYPNKTSELTNDSGFVTSDTKNTAGATASNSKRWIVGASSYNQSNSTTNTNNDCFMQSGALYSGGKIVATQEWVGNQGYLTTSPSSLTVSTSLIVSSSGKAAIGQSSVDNQYRLKVYANTVNINNANVPFGILASGTSKFDNIYINQDAEQAYRLYVNGISYFGSKVSIAGATTTSSPTDAQNAKFYVNGTSYLNNDAFVNGKLYIGYTGVYLKYTQPNTGTHALDIYCSLARINGTTTVTSDMRLKDVLSDIGDLTVDDVAKAPVFNFTWKDKRDSLVRVGTSAQYWKPVLANAVTDYDDVLSLDYGATALAAAVITARKVVDHEERIKVLEQKNERLEQENKWLEQENKWLKAEINALKAA